VQPEGIYVRGKGPSIFVGVLPAQTSGRHMRAAQLGTFVVRADGIEAGGEMPDPMCGQEPGNYEIRLKNRKRYSSMAYCCF